MDSIGDYYDRCRERLKEAQKELDEAIRNGADQVTISQLRQKRDDAGDTGD